MGTCTKKPIYNTNLMLIDIRGTWQADKSQLGYFIGTGLGTLGYIFQKKLKQFGRGVHKVARVVVFRQTKGAKATFQRCNFPKRVT